MKIDLAFEHQLSDLFGEYKFRGYAGTELSNTVFKKISRMILNAIKRTVNINVTGDDSYKEIIEDRINVYYEKIKNIKDTDELYASFVHSLVAIVFLIMGSFPRTNRMKKFTNSDSCWDNRLFRTISYSQNNDQKTHYIIELAKRGDLGSSLDFQKILLIMNECHNDSNAFISYIKENNPGIYLKYF